MDIIFDNLLILNSEINGEDLDNLFLQIEGSIF